MFKNSKTVFMQRGVGTVPWSALWTTEESGWLFRMAVYVLFLLHEDVESGEESSEDAKDTEG